MLKYLKVSKNIDEYMYELKLKSIEKIISIKYEVLTCIDALEYVKNYEVMQKIEEEYMKFVYNYIDIKLANNKTNNEINNIE